MQEQVLELRTLAIHDAAGALIVFDQPVIEKAEIAASDPFLRFPSSAF
jgi:hypothetical protein